MLRALSFQEADPDVPFPYSRADAEQLRQRQLSGESDSELGLVPDSKAGWIPICEQGCGHRTFLVISGECSGTVWDSIEGGLYLSCRAPGRLSKRMGRLVRAGVLRELPRLPAPPTFEMWYAGWIENGLLTMSHSNWWEQAIERWIP
jgi:hypothetical protein